MSDVMKFTNEQIEAIKLLYEAAKTFIPVVTGFLVLFSGALGYLWRDEREILKKSMVRHAGFCILLAINSLGFWSGTIPFCIRSLQHTDFERFKYGQYCAQAGHVLFFFSVICGVTFFWRVFLLHNRNSKIKKDHNQSVDTTAVSAPR